MPLGVVISKSSGSADKVFAELNQKLSTEGQRVVGTIQRVGENKTGRYCDMLVEVLPGGELLKINQQLGEGARGCRLDVSALESAIAMVEQEFAKGADLLIINKFGKHEGEGRGFRNLIGEALEQDVPVICGVNELNKPAFDEFAGPFAEYLPNDLAEIANWLKANQE